MQHKLPLQPACCLAISLWEMEQVVAAVGRVAHPSTPGPKVHEVKGKRGDLLLPAEPGTVEEGLELTTKVEDSWNTFGT